jgi:ABC-type sugar transport system ATPase subunit
VTAEFAGSRLTSENIARAIVGAADEPGAAVSVQSAKNQPPPQGSRQARPRTSESEPPVVDVRGWSDAEGTAFSDVDLTVHAGEAIFLTGQEDGGGRELLRSIARLRAAKGEAAVLPSPDGGTARYIPGSRASSMFPNLSVRDNLCVRTDATVIGGRYGLLRRRVMTEQAAALVKRLAIRTPGLGAPIRALSGGTQQKVAIGSALASAPKLLMLEDPTRGVDVQTRQELVAILRAFLNDGGAILAFSPELLEVFEMADSVRTVVRGRLCAPLHLTGDTTLEGLARWVDLMNQNLPGDGKGAGENAIERG